MLYSQHTPVICSSNYYLSERASRQYLHRSYQKIKKCHLRLQTDRIVSALQHTVSDT